MERNIVIPAGRQVLDYGDCGNGTNPIGANYGSEPVGGGGIDFESGNEFITGNGSNFTYCDGVGGSNFDCAHSKATLQLPLANTTATTSTGAATMTHEDVAGSGPHSSTQNTSATGATTATTTANATPATAIPMKKQNLLSTYLHRIFNHCKVIINLIISYYHSLKVYRVCVLHNAFMFSFCVAFRC